jgi:hypothetical protein
MIQQTRHPDKYGAWKGESVKGNLENDKGEGEPPPLGMDLTGLNHVASVKHAHAIQHDGRQD